jgi:hypothetical protein
VNEIRASGKATLITALIAISLLLAACDSSAGNTSNTGNTSTSSQVGSANVASASPTVPSVGLKAGTWGQIDTDGTVLYSVALNVVKDYGTVTVTGKTPAGGTLVEAVAAPQAAGQPTIKGGEVTWPLVKLDKGTIVGPFVYRVRFADGAAIPAASAATIAWQSPKVNSVEATAELQGVLQPLSESGSLKVDSTGTASFVAVGDTGIMAYVPAGAVGQLTTLNFKRVETQAMGLPTNTPSYWWCASVQISSDQVVQFSQPIALLLPTRAPLTPNLSGKAAAQNPDGSWGDGAGQLAETILSYEGGHVAVITNARFSLSSQPMTLAAGVTSSARQQGSIRVQDANDQIQRIRQLVPGAVEFITQDVQL